MYTMRFTLTFLPAAMCFIFAMPLFAQGDLTLKLRPLQSTCTIRAMAASAEPGGIDRRLRFLKRQLKRPPFKTYKSVKLLEEKELKGPQGAKRVLHLADGYTLQLRFIEPIADRKRRMRFRYHLSIFRGAGPPDPGTLFSILNRGTYLMEVGPLGEGALLLGLTCHLR